MKRKGFTINDLIILDSACDNRLDDVDIYTAQRTVVFRKPSHTANGVAFNRKNRKEKINSLRMFYSNFSQYEISPFYDKVNK